MAAAASVGVVVAGGAGGGRPRYFLMRPFWRPRAGPPPNAVLMRAGKAGPGGPRVRGRGWADRWPRGGGTGASADRSKAVPGRVRAGARKQPAGGAALAQVSATAARLGSRARPG